MSGTPGAARPRTWPTLLAALLDGHSLTADDTAWAMSEIMSGEATPVQVAGFAIALRAKGETADEVAGLATEMLNRAAPAVVTGRTVDIVGTGGDRSHTVNISTMAAIVAAAAGSRVAKHGNRAASSTCGAADLLEELGVVIDLAGPGVSRCVDEVGIGFCFAPTFHPSYRHTAAPRRELGVGTVFNYLGPLTNPARPTAEAVGCADPRMAAVLAGVLADRGTTGLVFRGDDGLDELTTTTTSRAWLVGEGEVEEAVVDLGALGIPACEPAALRGGDAPYNAAVARAVFAGEHGPVRDAVLLNAAAAIAAHDGISGSLDDALRAGLVKAAEAVDSGSTALLLDRWAAASQAAAADA